MMRTPLLVCVVSVLVLGCRPDPGDPDYPEVTPFVDTDDNGFLPGPDPFEEGDRRLSFGVFYEGASSDEIPIDDVSSHYYVYEGSFTQDTDLDRLEGLQSDKLVVSASTFWGGGLHFDNRIDLSTWSTMHIALRSSDDAMNELELGIVGSAGEVRAKPTDYGFAADGEWHVLDIPMTAFATAGLESTEVGLLIISGTAEPGTSVLFDDFYFKGE